MTYLAFDCILLIIRMQNICIRIIQRPRGEIVNGATPKHIAGLLKQIKTKLARKIKLNFNEYNLTFTQASVLMLLMKNGGMKISDISQKIGLSNSTTSGIIDRLEKMELVVRKRPESDRRVVNVYATETFSRFASNLEESLEQSFLELFGKATEKDIEDIVRGLEKFNSILDEAE